MAGPQVSRLIFGSFRGAIPTDKPSLKSFLELAPESPPPYVNTHKHDEDTLSNRWKRAENFIRASLAEKTPSRVEILSYSIGCHLAVKAASIVKTKAALFLVVPDPKYRVCEEDEIDKINEQASAFEECRDLWGLPRNGSPGEQLAQALLRLAQQQVEIHLVASMLDTVAEWDGNTQLLYENTQPAGHVHWRFPPKEPVPPKSRKSRKSRKYNVIATLNLLECESLSESWVHACLDCEITWNEGKRRTKGKRAP
jgi:hypothetical protein